MDERTGAETIRDTSTPPDAPDATRSDGAERDEAADDGGEESSGPLARARSVGAEAVGVVVDAVLDAL